MHKIHLITSFNSSSFLTQGKPFLNCYQKFWPKHITLSVFSEEEEVNKIINYDNINFFNLYKINKIHHNFVKKYSKSNILKKMDEMNIKSNSKFFKFDVTRFSFKTFSIINAVRAIKTDYLIWIDTDVITFDKIPDDFFDKIINLNKEAAIYYLDRGDKYHPECGFMIFNLKHKLTRKFINYWEALYKTENIFFLKEWHDSYVFKGLLKTFEKNFLNEFINVSINENKNLGHPFINSVLGDYMDHLKGDRVKYGKSYYTDLNLKKNHPYWQFTYREKVFSIYISFASRVKYYFLLITIKLLRRVYKKIYKTVKKKKLYIFNT